MTEEEHIARAMLLGMRYNKHMNYYFGKRRDGGSGFLRLDADTLEEISIAKAIHRQGIGKTR